MMQRFQRMVTIPEDEYRVLKSLQQVGDPLQSHFQSLSKTYAKQEAIKDPHDRVLRQGETLNEMIRTKDLLRQRVHAATPKPYQNRVASLYDYMKERMRVNEKGEILSTDGDAIEGSNVADLIQHAVRDRRRKYTPTGWNMFLSQLKDANAPKMLMNYDTLEELTPAAAARSPVSSSSSIVKAPKRRSHSVSPLLHTIKTSPTLPPPVLTGYETEATPPLRKLRPRGRSRARKPSRTTTTAAAKQHLKQY